MKKQIIFTLDTEDELYLRFVEFIKKHNQKISGVIKNALKLYLDKFGDRDEADIF